MLPLLLRSKGAYFSKIKELFGSSLIGYWPLWEASGTVARDISGNGRNATIGATTLAHIVGPTAKPAPYFDGTVSGVNLHTAGLASAFNGAEGAIMGWFKLNTGVWTDSAEHNLFHIRCDATNYIQISKRSTDNTMRFLAIMGGTSKNTSPVLYPTAFVHMCFSWSFSEGTLKFYKNGGLVSSVSGIGSWSGSPDAYMRVGSSNGLILLWNGWYQDVVFLNRVPTTAELQVVARAPNNTFKTIGILGDSISTPVINPVIWNYYVANEYLNGANCTCNHAIAGDRIITDMDAEVVAASSDDADLIIIALGTNDDNAGNMVALQAEAEENIVELKASNPRATLYWMNVLPRWTDAVAGPEVAKGNIRMAIAAACTAQSITCWDTYTVPWITQAQTADGCHPNAAGARAIADEVLALLP